jgi:hypothetical protein
VTRRLPIERTVDGGDADLRALYAEAPVRDDASHLSEAVWESLASGELTAAEHEQAIEHIASCQECGGIYRGLRMLQREASTFDAGVPAIEPPAEDTPSAWSLGPLRPVYLALAASLVLALWSASQFVETRRLAERLTQEESRARGLQASLDEQRAQSERERSQIATTLAELARPELNVPIVDLDPRSRVRGDRDAAAAIEVPASAKTIAFVLGTSGRHSYPNYAVEITNAQGQVTWSGEGLRKSRFETFTLAVPRSALPDNDIRVRVFGVRNGQRELVEEYSARFRFQ